MIKSMLLIFALTLCLVMGRRAPALHNALHPTQEHDNEGLGTFGTVMQHYFSSTFGLLMLI